MLGSHRRAWLAVGALGAGIGLGALGLHLNPAEGASGGTDFIVRCFYNGHTAHQDTIMAPGGFNTGHLHDFFGNVAAGYQTAGNVQFPNMGAGDATPTPADSMENNGYTNPTGGTNCQVSKDSAGYWVPTPYVGSSQDHPNGGCTTNCDINHLYMRVYYISGASTNKEIPDGSLMVTGFPSGCTNVSGINGASQPPPGCSSGVPNDTDIVQYSCGASSGNTIVTPASAWPYDCTNYTDSDDSFSDGNGQKGLIARVLFPTCWDGTTGNFHAPNDPTKTVPGYVAPWIEYQDPYTNPPSRPANDFAYADANGICPSGYPKKVVRLEERVHLLVGGAGWGEPSSCLGANGKDWNSISNAENSSAQGTGSGDTGDGTTGANDADATIKLANKVWGFHLCQARNTPRQSIALSFACSPDLDTAVCSTTGGTAQPDTGQTGCATPAGQCYYGFEGNGTGWETFHADYWQTWREGGGGDTLTTEAPQGSFPDLIEDCISESKPCSFIRDDLPTPIPSAVYGSATK